MTGLTNKRRDCSAALFSGFVSAGLILGLALMPLSQVAFGAQNAILGSVSAVGGVELRGVPLQNDGTLFDGDRIETSGQSYVKVQLTDGPQFELGNDTDVRVDRGDSQVQIAMNRGSMAFSSPSSSLPVQVSIESVTVEALPGAAAEIAFLEPNSLSVTALAESVMVTALGMGPAPVGQDEQVIIPLDAQPEAAEPPPTPPGAETDDETAGGSSTKVVVISASAAAAAGAVVFIAKRDKDPASGSQP